MKRITQTAGRNALKEFSLEFAHFNDDILFGENWNNQDIDLKTRSIITVVASDVFRDNGFIFNISSYKMQKNHGVTQKEIAASYYSCRILCGLAKGHGQFSIWQRKYGSRRKEILPYEDEAYESTCEIDGISNWCSQMMAFAQYFVWTEVFLHRYPQHRLAFST